MRSKDKKLTSVRLHPELFNKFKTRCISEDFTFKKLVDLNDPWGSSFINNEELIINEKNGKIKIANIIS